MAAAEVVAAAMAASRLRIILAASSLMLGRGVARADGVRPEATAPPKAGENPAQFQAVALVGGGGGGDGSACSAGVGGTVPAVPPTNTGNVFWPMTIYSPISDF